MIWKNRKIAMRTSHKNVTDVQNNALTYDTEHNIASAELYYDSPESILDMTVSKGERVVVSNDALEYVIHMNHTVPKWYSIDYSFVFDTLANYSPTVVLDAIKKALKNRFDVTNRQHCSRTSYAIIFVMLGVIIATIVASNLLTGGLVAANDESIHTIMESIFDELKSLFISEAGCILFLSYALEPLERRSLFRKFGSISVKDANGHVLCSITKRDLYENWSGVSRAECFATGVIPFISTLSVVMIVIELIGYLFGVFAIEDNVLFSYILDWTLALVVFFCNLLFYLGHPFGKKAAIPVSIVYLLECIVFVIYTCMNMGTGNVTDRYLSFAIFDSACIFFNLTALIYLKLKDKKRHREASSTDTSFTF